MGTISQHHTQLLEFGSEIVTRDFKQAKPHIQSRMKTKQKQLSSYGRPKFLLKLEAGKSASIFFFFLHLTSTFFLA